MPNCQIVDNSASIEKRTKIYHYLLQLYEKSWPKEKVNLGQFLM